MEDWFENLYELGRQLVESARAKNSWDGIIRSLVDKYADPVHFAYELLQNADDQEATEATFRLHPDRLIFEHNGTPFTPKDVERITEIGNSDKPDQGNKIGRYGIGFKSVFAIMDRPQVFTSLDTEPFAFAIEDLVVPVRLHCPDGFLKNGTTRFILPLKPKAASEIYLSIDRKLRELGADTLLFLNHLTVIHWTAGSDEGTYLCARDPSSGECHLIGEHGRTGEEKSVTETTYLTFAKRVHEIAPEDDPKLQNLRVQIAFRLQDGEVVEEPGQSCLNVYFPTNERTGLKFRLHAPMLLTPDRASIRKNNPLNSRLIQACADLLVETLANLRERGLLSVSCLNCLPIRKQDFPATAAVAGTVYREGSPFRPLFDAVCEALKSQPLLPTAEDSSRSHVRAAHAKLSDSVPLRSLMSEPQLTMLFGMGIPTCWLSDQIREKAGSSRELYAFLRDEVGVEEIDSEKFARRLDGHFLEEQTDEWVVRFYRFLLDSESLWAKHKPQPILRRKPIIRLEDGSHIAPFKDDGTPTVFLPVGREHGLATVKRAIVQQEDAQRFLTALGLKQPDVVDEVLRLTLPRYARKEITTDDPAYLADIAAISEAVEQCASHERSELENALLTTPFVMVDDGAGRTRVGFKKPGQTIAPTPETRMWHSGNADIGFVSTCIAKDPSWQVIQRFLNRQRTIISGAIQVRARSADGSGHVEFVDEHARHERGLHGFDPDATIPGLDHVLVHITRDRARLLWRVLEEHIHVVQGMVEKSRYQEFRNSTQHRAWSVLGEACHQAAWLPDADGKWHKPSELYLSDLPPDFVRDTARAKELAEKLGMKAPRVSKVEQAAHGLGFPPDFMEKVYELFTRDRDSAIQIVNTAYAKLGTGGFPESTLPNPERRALKAVQDVADAPGKNYEVRQRSVRTSLGEVGEDKKTYLRDLYTNADGEMYCQLCQEVMPFQRDNQSFYFEAIECIGRPLIAIEHRANYLALCPVCAAKYRDYHQTTRTSDDELRRAILESTSLVIEMILARDPAKLRFVQTHLIDLKAVLKDGNRTRS